MLLPKRVKYRRQHRPSVKGKSKGGNQVSFGDYGLQATTTSWVTSRQIEAARIAMTRATKRTCMVWIRVFPDKPLTAKPLETRMGKGKGAVEKWVMNIKPGRIIYEMGSVDEALARSALALAQSKLPFKTKIVTREGENEIY